MNKLSLFLLTLATLVLGASVADGGISIGRWTSNSKFPFTPHTSPSSSPVSHSGQEPPTAQGGNIPGGPELSSPLIRSQSTPLPPGMGFNTSWLLRSYRLHLHSYYRSGMYLLVPFDTWLRMRGVVSPVERSWYLRLYALDPTVTSVPHY